MEKHKRRHVRWQWLLNACLMLGFAAPVLGQSLDSLEKVLATTELTNKEKIAIYEQLAYGMGRDNPIRSRSFSRKGLQLAKTEGDERAAAAFLYALGSAYFVSLAYDSSAFYLEKALVLARQNNDSQREVTTLRMHGQLYRQQGLYEKALKWYMEARKLADQLNDPQQLFDIYTGIGGTYHVMDNNKQALLYYGEAEKAALRSQNRQNLGSLYFALSSVYSELDDGKAQAIHYAHESFKIHQESGSPYPIIRSLNTLADAYYADDDYANAMKYAEDALRLADSIGNAHLVASSYITISNIHYFQQQYDKSIEAALAVLENDSTDYNYKETVFFNLGVIYARVGNFELMEDYFKRYKETVNSYSNETYQSSLTDMEVKYETEKKELQIASLEKQHQLSVWLGVAGIVILLIALAFAFIRYRLAVSRRKLAEEETQRLEQEKQLVAVQATLDGEAAERTRLAKDLHDGLGSMLSLVKFNLPQVTGEAAVLESIDVSRFQKAIGMLDDSIQELRRVAHHMMPESLLRYGLKVSLADFCSAIPVAEFHYFGDEARLSEKMEIMIYRCIHELVNNALKHTQANHINVQLVQEEDRLSFTVQDDGVGFDQAQTTEGMGLQNVRQRVAAFQGEIHIYSSKQGTEIHVELGLPIPNAS